MRQAIVDGRLAPGAALPSTRELSSTLGLAGGTVVAAVDQLAVEGLVETRQGAATRVAHVPIALRSPASHHSGPPVRLRRPAADFGGGDPDLTLFPRSWWGASVRRVLARAESDALGYGEPAGSLELRHALTDCLGRTRGVVAAPERVMITAGFSHALAVLGRTMVVTGARSVAVEDPSLGKHRELLAGSGLEVVPVAVDGEGLRVDDLPARAGSGVLVTPAHHMPLGMTLSPARRSELAAWAARHDALVVEDDYDGELRYDRRPLPALQALDATRVIYAGTASKALAPALRLGWCVLPPDLVDAAAVEMAALGGQPVSIVEQLALAELLQSGRYDRHIRKLHTIYRRRRDELVAALGVRLPTVRIEGVAAGLKALIRLPPDADESAVVNGLTERSVAVAGLSWFRFHDAAGPSPAGPAIVVNYSRPFGHEYRAAVEQLIDGLAAVLRSPATA